MTNPENSVTVDSLLEKVSTTKQKLEELKASITTLSDSEKNKKATELVTLKSEIKESKKQLNKLKRQTIEDADKDRVSQIESDISQMESDYEQLYAEVSSKLSELSQDIKDGSKKGWLATQWEGLTSKDEWKDNTGKNVARLLGGVGIVGGVARLGKKIFGRKDYQDEIEGYDQMTRKEKRKARKEWKKKKKLESKKEGKGTSFWDKWYGKALKWTGIGTGIYYVAHGIKTGKRKFKDFFDWKKAGLVSDLKTNREDYLDFKKENPEKYVKYEDFGDNVNDMYEQIWATEGAYFDYDGDFYLGALGNKVEEELKAEKKGKEVEHEETKGMIPRVMDDFYSNVDDILSHGGVERYMGAKTIEDYKERIKAFGSKWFAKVLFPFLKIPAQFGIKSSDDEETKMNKYLEGIDKDKETHLSELNMIFRQYLKVVLYLVDKKNAVSLKVAEESLKKEGKWPSTESEQKKALAEKLDDGAWVESTLEKDSRYTRFLNSRIVGLKDALGEDLYNSDMTFLLSDLVSSLDASMEKILGGDEDNNKLKNVEDKIKAGNALDDADKKGLGEVVDGIIKDIDTQNEESFGYGILKAWFDAFGAEEADRKRILKESGLDAMFAEVADGINTFKSQVIENPTVENVEKLKALVGKWAALKKELMVSIYAIQKARENKNALDVVKAVVKGFVGTLVEGVKAIYDIIFEGKLTLKNVVKVAVAGAEVGACYLIFTANGRKFTWKAATSGFRWCKMGVYAAGSKAGSHFAARRRIYNISRTNPAKAENLLKRGVLDGSLSEKDVKKIVDENKKLVAKSGKQYGFKCLDGVTGNEYRAVVNSAFDGKLTSEQVDLLLKYRDSGIKGGWIVEKMGVGSNKGYTVKIEDDFFKHLKRFDKLQSQRAELLKDFLGKVESVEDLKYLVDLGNDGKFIQNLTFLNKYTPKELAEDVAKGLKSTEIKSLANRVHLMKKTVDEINTLRSSGRVPEQLLEKSSKFLKGISSLSSEEIKAFWHCMDSGFKFTHMLDLTTLAKQGVVGKFEGQQLKKLMEEGDMDKICKYLTDNVDDLKAVKGLNHSADKLVKGLSEMMGKASKKITAKVIKGGMPKVLKFILKML